MKRTTIFADEELINRLKQIAQEDKLSMAELIRKALERFAKQREGVKKLPSFVGIGRSGQKDIAERHEELLWKKLPARKNSAV